VKTFYQESEVNMTSRKVTIADVAREAGVSSGTVSRVLNPPPDQSVKISEATRELVMSAVNRLGYQTNPFASALRSQRTGVIGAIIRDINDPFLSLMARELQHIAHSHGVELLMGHAEYDLETVRRQLKFMGNWFDGLLIIGDMPGDQAIFEDLRQADMPYVAVACGTKGVTPLVNVDEEYGTRMGLEYLYALGHRRIGFIGNTNHAGIRERWAAFERFIAEKSLVWQEGYLQSCPYTRVASISAVQNLLSLPLPPTAILCTSDLQALGAVSGAWQMGWRVPEAVSIMGFDDIEEASDTFPALTTVRQPVGDMANEAMSLLMKLIQDPSKKEGALDRIIVKPRLMVRRSCSPTYG
jgi:LacI family transcriptional regulator, repressor for deo operon, udp, cdd, tsx, nupC, and nupG